MITPSMREVKGLFFFSSEMLFVTGEVYVTFPPPRPHLSYDAPVTSAVARALGAIRPPSGGDGRERQIESKKRERVREAGVAGPGLTLVFMCRRWDAPWSEWNGCREAPAPPLTWCLHTSASGRRPSRRPSWQIAPSSSGSVRKLSFPFSKSHTMGCIS